MVTINLTFRRTAGQFGSKVIKMKWLSRKGSVLRMLRICPITLIPVSDIPPLHPWDKLFTCA